MTGLRYEVISIAESRGLNAAILLDAVLIIPTNGSIYPKKSISPI